MARATRPSRPTAMPPAAQLPPEDKSQVEKAKDETSGVPQRPSSGRTTSLGRRVEKPAPTRQGGPSGQTDGVQHHRKHANK